MRRLILGGALAMGLLGGCVSLTPLPGPGDGRDAVYVHPTTGVVTHCERPHWMAREILTAIFYAHCKTTAEDAGARRTEAPALPLAPKAAP